MVSSHRQRNLWFLQLNFTPTQSSTCSHQLSVERSGGWNIDNEHRQPTRLICIHSVSTSTTCLFLQRRALRHLTKEFFLLWKPPCRTDKNEYSYIRQRNDVFRNEFCNVSQWVMKFNTILHHLSYMSQSSQSHSHLLTDEWMQLFARTHTKAFMNTLRPVWSYKSMSDPTRIPPVFEQTHTKT